MAQRRPITSHPAFAPFVALWFAALLGLIVAVLPAALLERALAVTGIGALAPLTATGRVLASIGAAVLGGLGGLALGTALARRNGRDPRPIYDEVEALHEPVPPAQPARRPLRVREELPVGLADDAAAAPVWDRPDPDIATPAPLPSLPAVEAEEGFMILSPQPVHPPLPEPDLDALIAQFDNALAAFRADDHQAQPDAPGGDDPVHAFVARQTGAPAPAPAPSPLGGHMPDHQAELRAALAKLARAHRKD